MRIKFSFLPVIFFTFGLHTLFAQSNAWVDMFSYLKVKHLQYAENKVYAQSDNAFFMYDTSSGEIEKFSSVNGLNGDPISGFYYHDALKKLFVFHEGGLIEVVNEQKKVFRSPELSYNTFIPISKKKLLNVFADGNKLYLATPYGISVYNLANNEFGDTYYVNSLSGYTQVNDIQIYNDNIYAATQQGLYKASINDNLIDQTVWQKIDPASWKALTVFNGDLIGAKNYSLVKINSTGFQNLFSFSQPISSLKNNTYLTIGFAHKISVYNTNYILEQNFEDNTFTNERFYEAIDDGQYIYIGSEKHGVLKTGLGQSTYEYIHPDGPLSNHAYVVDVKDDVLWMAYGDLFELNPYPLYKQGLSSYQNKAWVNIPYEDFQMSDVCFVKINPTNTSEVYFGSTMRGLLRVRNNQIDQIFNQNNSPLSILPGEGSVRVFDLTFDTQNNLWVTHTPEPFLLKLKPDDTWETTDLSGMFSGFPSFHGTTVLISDAEDHLYMGTEFKGLVGYDPKTQNLVSVSDGLQNAYPQIKTMDIDKDNVLWIGNNYGLRILNNPNQIFSDSNVEFKPIKIVYEDAVQLLMEGQNITKIKVDGANNKWIATLGSGVYYLSEDGTKTIFHFTKENSPLPSNDIYDIAVDGSNGMVYFATLDGLIGYKGLATEGGDNLDDVYAFPNPVNQKQHEFATIRGLMEGVDVKIVDIAGNLVYETVSKGGSVQWDLTAFGKYKVATGVYIALITNEDGTQTQTTKILVVK